MSTHWPWSRVGILQITTWNLLLLWLEASPWYRTSKCQRTSPWVQISDVGLNKTSPSAWGKITDGVPACSVLGPLLFLTYVSGLPKTVNDKTVPILFADDTSIIVKSSNSKDFQTNMVTAFHCVNKWFKINLPSINIDKTHYIQFKTKSKPTHDINIVCNDNLITTVPQTKFLGMYIYMIQ